MTGTDGDARRQALIAELDAIRRKGLPRLREVRLAALDAVPARLGGAEPTSAAGGLLGVERLLEEAAGALKGDRLRAAARITFGLDSDTRDLSAKDRRERACVLFDVGVDRFRRHQEKTLLAQLADAVLSLPADAADRAPAPVRDQAAPAAPGKAAAPRAAPPSGRRVVPVRYPHGTVPVTVHVAAMESLRGVDVLVSSENVYFEMSKTFRDTVSGSLRRAGARKDAAGRILDDVIARQLTAWLTRFGSSGLPVAAGTVVPTSPGELAGQGVRRIYHAAIVSPLLGTDRYQTAPWIVSAAVHRIFELGRTERSSGRAALRSIALPLLGAGRGGLDPRASVEAILTALGPALDADPDWQVHFAVRDAEAAGVVLDALDARRSPGVGTEAPRVPVRRP